MRCFLGLDLSAQAKVQIEDWRHRALPTSDVHVPACNFHITSVFLGSLPLPVLDRLGQYIDDLSLPQCDIHLDELGYWSKPKVTFLTASQPSSSLTLIASKLAHVAQRCSIKVEDRKYVPHVTLSRKTKTPPPAPLLAPDIKCHFTHLHLFESQSTQHGVRYPIRHSWPLTDK